MKATKKKKTTVEERDVEQDAEETVVVSLKKTTQDKHLLFWLTFPFLNILWIVQAVLRGRKIDETLSPRVYIHLLEGPLIRNAEDTRHLIRMTVAVNIFLSQSLSETKKNFPKTKRENGKKRRTERRRRRRSEGGVPRERREVK